MFETALMILVFTGLSGAGFLLRYIGEMIWFLKRSGDPGIMVIDAAAIGWALWFAYLLLVLSGWVVGWPDDSAPYLIVIGFGVAITPWWIVYRWRKWRNGRQG
jgi:hypothetical protein